MTLDPWSIQLLEIMGFFLVGFITWSLALYRLLAFERRRVNLLSTLVFIEEFTVLFLGVWLANDVFKRGLLCAIINAAAIAAGGTLAARIIVKRAKVKDVDG